MLTRPDAPAGRGRRLATLTGGRGRDRRGDRGAAPTPPERPGVPGQRLAELAPDAAPIVAYGGLIPPAALAVPAHGWVNLHFSLLPAWRGAAPVQHAIIAGDQVTGACTFQLEEGLDTGPVFGVVDRGDRSARHRRRPAGAPGRVRAPGCCVATIDGIEAGALVPAPQAADGCQPRARSSPSRTRRCRWSDPAMRVDRLIRGCTPAPGAWTTVPGRAAQAGSRAAGPEVAGLRARRARARPRTRSCVGTATHAGAARRGPGRGAQADARG